jgi:hypothetical protein
MSHQHPVHTGTLSGSRRSSLPQTKIHSFDSTELQIPPNPSSSLLATPYSLLLPHSTRYHGHICPAPLRPTPHVSPGEASS